jgi:hypothetical protein
VTNFNGKIWGPGNMKVTSDKYHVVERYTLVGDTLEYRVVIEDPGVLTGPFSPKPDDPAQASRDTDHGIRMHREQH